MASKRLVPDAGHDKRYYVYVYRDPRPGEELAPIYVGKGTARQKRADFHWKVKAANSFFSAILDKIRADGLDPIIEIAARFDDERDAFSLERELIRKFGRRNTGHGTLTNLTDGGDGASGYVPTAEEREISRTRMRRTRSRQWEDPKFREAAIRNLHLANAKMRSDTIFQQRRAALRAATMAADPVRTDKQRAKMKALRAVALENPQAKEKFVDAMVAGRKNRWAVSPERRTACSAKIRSATKAAWSDPKFRENLVAKNSKTMKAKWADPDYRAKQGAKLSALLRAAWADPEKRALMLANRAKRKEAAARG